MQRPALRTLICLIFSITSKFLAVAGGSSKKYQVR
jgi:hypothetical protein